MGADLRALLIGIAGSAVAYFAIEGGKRYLARRSIRGRQRQIQQLTQELQLLEKLGVSDRSLLLFAFQMLFGLLAMAGIGMTGALALWLLSRWPVSELWLLLPVSTIALTGLAFWAVSVFKKLEDPNPTLGKLRVKLSELERSAGARPLSSQGGAAVDQTRKGGA